MQLSLCERYEGQVREALALLEALQRAQAQCEEERPKQESAMAAVAKSIAYLDSKRKVRALAELALSRGPC